MTHKEVTDLFQFDGWATGKILEAAAALDHEQYERNLGSSFGGIRGTLLHLYSAARNWLARWKGQERAGVVTPEEMPTLSALLEHWNQLTQDRDAFIRSLGKERLMQPITYRSPKGKPHSELLYRQMQHVVNHSSYHRGQVVTMLRQLGVQPPSTDLIRFYRERSGPALIKH